MVGALRLRDDYQKLCARFTSGPDGPKPLCDELRRQAAPVNLGHTFWDAVPVYGSGHFYDVLPRRHIAEARRERMVFETVDTS